jgi:hypothetical protein
MEQRYGWTFTAAGQLSRGPESLSHSIRRTGSARIDNCACLAENVHKKAGEDQVRHCLAGFRNNQGRNRQRADNVCQNHHR